jgi:hypothetical protein
MAFITNLVSKKDVVFIQRDNSNSAYGEIHASGSLLIPYLDSNGNITIANSSSFYTTFPPSGATGTFTTVDGKTVTVTNGIITSILP